jgi:hypothetical protein
MKNSKPKNTDHKLPSAVALSARLATGAGVHADQRRKADPKQLRRDKSYKDYR